MLPPAPIRDHPGQCLLVVVWLVEPLRLLHGEMGSLKQPAHPEPCLPYAYLSLQWMLPMEMSCFGALVITPKDSSWGLTSVAMTAAMIVKAN